jgi:hypothetical protein
LGAAFNVAISFPRLTIRLAQADSLTDYDMWIVFSGLLSNLVFGFGVAWITNTVPARTEILKGITFVGVLLLAVSLVRAVYLRVKISRNVQTLTFQLVQDQAEKQNQ